MAKTDYYNSKFESRSFPIIVVSDHVTSDRNIGSLFRVCDAYGVKELIICGGLQGLGRKGRQTSRATEQHVRHHWYDDSIEVVSKLKNKGHHIIGLEITEDSQPLNSYKVPASVPLVLVIGDERYGISEDILSLADDIIHIEMFGHNSSMNVVQATNAALYELTRQLL